MRRKITYRKMQSRDLFFEEDKMRDAMHGMGNPLDRVQEMIDIEMFRPTLEEALENKNRKNNAGRKPFDPVLMFKILFLQRYYGLVCPGRVSCSRRVRLSTPVLWRLPASVTPGRRTRRSRPAMPMTCLVYNVFRFIQIRHYHSDWFAEEA